MLTCCIWGVDLNDSASLDPAYAFRDGTVERLPMAARACVACTRPAGEGYLLCPSCGDRLADHLAAVGDLYHELGMTQARWDDLSVALARGGECGLPYAETATRAGIEMVAVLGRWAGKVALARASVWSVPNTVPAVAHWLAMRIDWLRALEDAGAAYEQIDRVVCRARVVIDRPASRTSFLVGACPEIRDNRHCLGEVWAWIPTRIGIDPAVLRCRNVECRRHTDPWLTESWYEVGRRMLRLKDQLKSRAIPPPHSAA